MRFYLIIITFLLSKSAMAQIADASYFPSVKSLNPGILHLRDTGFIALDKSKTSIKKHHDVQTGGLIDGVNTTIDLDKTTIIREGKGGGITLGFLIDTETALRQEKIKKTGLERIIDTEATSSYRGLTLDLGFIGVTMGKATYNYFYEFRVGEVPNISASDRDFEVEFDSLKIGTSFKIGMFSIGAYMLNQTSSGELAYSYYNPSTGLKGSTENFKIEDSTKAYGVGVGYTNKVIRVEGSLEKITQQKLSKPDDYPIDVIEPPLGTRVSAVVEFRVGKIALGGIIRKIEGNYSDLENIITSKLLYEEMTAGDERLETSFNFAYGNSTGFSVSGFLTQAETKTEEESNLYNNDIKYDATYKTNAYGVTLSYSY